MRALASALIGGFFVAACSGRAFESTSARVGDAALTGRESGGASANSGGSGGSKGGSGSGAGGSLRASGGRVGTGAGGAGGAGGTGGSVPPPGGAGGSASSTSDAGPPASCNVPSDCPKPGTVCQTAACLGHQCGFVAAPLATPPGNAPGDCRKIVCSPNGTETILADPSDTDDGNECTVDSCQGSAPSHTSSVGAHCQNGTKYCDAAGLCVQCISDAQCPGGSTECTKATCVQGTCRQPAAGTLCNGGVDQCDGQGSCLDCWDNGGCDECCFCLDNFCVQG